MSYNIKVIKRDGKRVEFNSSKIAIAIKKGFDSVTTGEAEAKYSEADINLVFNKVIEDIKERYTEKIKIEEIQDLIEEELKKEGYDDVYKSFSEYRERRAQSRKAFIEGRKQHKFFKSLEEISFKKENINAPLRNPYEMMIDYGSIVSREFAKTYMMKKKYSDLVEDGEIYIHDLHFMPLGTTTSTQIDLEKLFNEGFYYDNIHIREPKSIESYVALTIQAITINQKEQHGAQSIPLFDYYMAPGVLKTFKKIFKDTLDNYMDYTDLGIFAATSGIEREIERLDSANFDISIFDKYSRNSEILQRMFRIAYRISIDKTKKAVSQAMEAFVHDINVIANNMGNEKNYPTINLGTDTSFEGRMVTEKFLDAMDFGVDNNSILISPNVVYKIKNGVNAKEEDKNYDLYLKAIDIASRKGYPNFSFVDAPLNKKINSEDKKEKEAAYDIKSFRIYDNFVDSDKEIVPGRCLLSATTINLARIGIRNSKLIGIREVKGKNYEDFYNELEQKMDLIKEQLLERFETQGNKKTYEFPFLIKEGILLDGEKAKDEDKIRKVIKQGIMIIGFVGLEECIMALTKENRLSSKVSEKLGLQIVKFMRNKTEEYSNKYNLNFVLAGIDDDKICREFMDFDKAIFGNLEGITNKDRYTNSFYLSDDEIELEKKIKIEAPYHELTNGGHSIRVIVDEGEKEILKEDLEKLSRVNVGYASIVKKKFK